MSVQQSNGNGKKFSLPTFGCEGCEDRKAMLTAGNWQIDAALFALILLAAFVMFKVKIA